MNGEEMRWATAEADVAAGMPRVTMGFDRDLAATGELAEMQANELWLFRWDPTRRTLTGIPRRWP